jgi:hypothetical protein
VSCRKSKALTPLQSNKDEPELSIFLEKRRRKQGNNKEPEEG